jgi:hypothetical protein
MIHKEKILELVNALLEEDDTLVVEILDNATREELEDIHMYFSALRGMSYTALDRKKLRTGKW